MLQFLLENFKFKMVLKLMFAMRKCEVDYSYFSILLHKLFYSRLVQFTFLQPENYPQKLIMHWCCHKFGLYLQVCMP